jgi:cell division protein FtsI/penicillin-binding protein 2
VVVVVLIEHGGFGAQAAAPAAKEIYQAYFHVR